MQMMKMKKRSHKYDINRPSSRDLFIYFQFI